MEKVRYESMDLMKGICIVIVIIFHLKLPYLYFPYMTLFMLPAFFFCSGMFFQRHNSFKEFLLKKTNTLLVPYLFFSMTNILIIFTFYLKDIQKGWLNAYNASMALHNGPVWFLLCLYFMSITYYAVCCIEREWIKTLLVLFLSFVGYLLGQKNISLPLYIDVMFSSLVFYHCGYLFKSKNGLAEAKVRVWVKFICTLMFFIGVALVLDYIPQLELANNDIPMPFYYYILTSISGTLMIAFFSMLLVRFSVVNYLGRYSIIILCTHWVLIRIWGYLLPHIFMQNPLVLWGIFVFVLLSSFPLIRLFVVCFPKYCGQMPLLKM